MATTSHVRAFQQRTLAWYRVHQRKLPWRATRNPYKILVSEVMLQQTQVDRVVPKYREFLRRYPTLKAVRGCVGGCVFIFSLSLSLLLIPHTLGSFSGVDGSQRP